MSLFHRPHYRSELTVFLEQLHHADHSLTQRQRKGRLRLWDKLVDRATWRGFRQAEKQAHPGTGLFGVDQG
jgi:hypothetical protein